jgi:SAM-dependent methyltransferase
MTRPFSPSVRYYDVVYQHLDYPGTAATVASIIEERNPAVRSLLDMSCGTGLHLQQFRDRFDHVEGADVDPAMIEVASARLGDEVPLHVADYTGFDLGRTFDAITCLFSSIGYAHTPARLDAAIAAMSGHLAPGGVLVVEPWLLPHTIEPPWLRTHVAEADDMVVLRSTVHRFDGDAETGGVSDMDFTYLVTTMDGSEILTEHHVMGSFPATRHLEAFERAGLEAEFLEGQTELGRGLVVGVRR